MEPLYTLVVFVITPILGLFFVALLTEFYLFHERQRDFYRVPGVEILDQEEEERNIVPVASIYLDSE